MRKNRQMQLILILAICVSIVGISLGFAAFSNTLTISSSAIVKPDQKDFFLRAYGLAEANMDEDLWSYEPYKSTNISKPFIYGGSATDAVIESSNGENGKNEITISNLHMTWTEPDQAVEYWFMIKNEGHYDAYIAQSEFDKLVNLNESIICTAITGTSEDMVENACDYMDIHIEAHSSDQTIQLDKDGGTGENYIKINKYTSESDFDYITIALVIQYKLDARADGDFKVTFPNISLEFTSAPPMS